MVLSKERWLIQTRLLQNFRVISTFPVLPVACCLRVRIREIKNYYFKSCSDHLYVCNQSPSFISSLHQQMEVINLWENQDTFNHFLSFLCIWWFFAKIWRNFFSSFSSLWLNFKIHFTCKYLIICILWIILILVNVIFPTVLSWMNNMFLRKKK